MPSERMAEEKNTSIMPESGAPPRIAPIPSGVERPLWSIMIPTFNCAQYLRQTLESVLAQDPGPAHMQIEVVDDVSTKDDPEAVVREVGKGRVKFHRKAKNEGATTNFNTCIERSRGHLVHILHGDDKVEPGFYSRFAAAFEESPGCAVIFARAFIIDEKDKLLELSDDVPSLRCQSADASGLLLINPIRTPAAVIRRNFYERHGGFDPALVHTADWEMWVRAITQGGGRMVNWPLASYRSFGANDSSRLMQTAENLRDAVRLATIWESRGIIGFDRRAFDHRIAREAFVQWRNFRTLGRIDATRANYAFLRNHMSVRRRLYLHLRAWVGSIKRYLDRGVI